MEQIVIFEVLVLAFEVTSDGVLGDARYVALAGMGCTKAGAIAARGGVLVGGIAAVARSLDRARHCGCVCRAVVQWPGNSLPVGESLCALQALKPLQGVQLFNLACANALAGLLEAENFTTARQSFVDCSIFSPGSKAVEMEV
jgi:hypothetical protein